MLKTPYYLIDKAALRANLDKIARLRARSGAKCLLALKCFATWAVFDLMRESMDGTTSSSLYEVQLGREKFGGETHAYSVAWADDDMPGVIAAADKVIFNSISQLERFGAEVAAAGIPCGLRVNPGVSSSGFELADPARPFSRLGEADPDRVAAVLERISGVMFHNNCENGSLEVFERLLAHIEQRFGHLLARLSWVSLGGGIHFTGEGYPLDAFADRLRAFSERYGVQVYLEPGEAAITGAATLETTVLDIVENGRRVAIVDSSTEAHMLDLLIYRLNARRVGDGGPHDYIVAGKTCLAGDIFGEFGFAEPLKVGDRISFADAAGYTMVKKNWFNGIAMPAIVVKQLDGQLEVVRTFSYADYVASLS
ncbi:MAG: carboxynorspermidine decarboxylase [Moraxellaceae bacterium]